MSPTYEGSSQNYDVICDLNMMVKTRDGTGLATDLYFPAINGSKASGTFPVLLERTPYDKASPTNVSNGKYFALII